MVVLQLLLWSLFWLWLLTWMLWLLFTAPSSVNGQPYQSRRQRGPRGRYKFSVLKLCRSSRERDITSSGLVPALLQARRDPISSLALSAFSVK